MAIKVSGVNVIDNERNANVGILTATSIDLPPSVLTFSPSDASSGNLVGTNIVLTFSATVTKGTGNILLNSGSAGGTTLQTIDVTSGNVTISGSEVTINPPSNLPTGADIYVVVPADAFKNTALNAGNEVINTYNFTTGPVLATNFSPTDGSDNFAVDSNIVITFSENIAKGSGNITIRSGGASGTVQQTIDVTSGAVSVSGTQATINPPSDLAYLTDTYIVVGSGCFLNADEVALSGNAEINTYNFTTEPELELGDAFEGGYFICQASSVRWITAPGNANVIRCWYERSHANSRVHALGLSGSWFIPTRNQLKNPGYQCRQYWNALFPTANCTRYWSNNFMSSPNHPRYAWGTDFSNGSENHFHRNGQNSNVRSFRCVSY